MVGCGDKNIKIMYLKNEKIIKDLKGHNNHIIWKGKLKITK